MANTLLTQQQKLTLARNFIDHVSSNDNFYYFFTGNPDVNANTDDLFDATKSTVISAYRNMIQGKLINPNNILPVVRNIPYESNKVFDMYDGSDETLLDKEFYAIVNAGSFSHVFKCLDNNLGANSTSEPNFAHIQGANTTLYQTADGYRWKYLYSVSSAIVNNFSSSINFPFIANTEVEASAVRGALDIIKIEDGGRGYDNYLVGAFQAADVRVNGNSTLYALSTTNSSIVNGFYTGCLLYISAGAGIGEYRSIVDYFCNGNGNFLVVNSALTTPMNGSQYQIFPGVLITGDGSETVTAVARAMVNSSSSNSIYRIEMLNRGLNYAHAVASVIANSVIGIDVTATIRPIHGPRKGHGYDAASELDFLGLGFNIALSNSEGNTLLTSGAYKTIGIIQQPKFANVHIELANSSGAFTPLEKMHAIKPLRIGVASINTSCSTLTFSNSDISGLTNSVLLYLKSSNGSTHSLARINSIVNSTVFDLTTNGAFACSTTFVYLANSISEFHLLTTIDSINIRVQNVVGHFSLDDFIIGNSSGMVAYVNAISRNDVVKEFDTFIQLYKFDTSGGSGIWTPDENVTNNNSMGLLQSAINSGPNVILYTSNQVGQFVNGNILTGQTSGAMGTVSNVYSPELIFGSGDVIYMENVPTAITRANNQAEVFKIFLRF